MSWTVFAALGLSLWSAMSDGVYPSFEAELYPEQVRYTGVSLTHNIAYGLFGGMAP